MKNNEYKVIVKLAGPFDFDQTDNKQTQAVINRIFTLMKNRSTATATSNGMLQALQALEQQMQSDSFWAGLSAPQPAAKPPAPAAPAAKAPARPGVPDPRGAAGDERLRGRFDNYFQGERDKLSQSVNEQAYTQQVGRHQRPSPR